MNMLKSIAVCQFVGIIFRFKDPVTFLRAYYINIMFSLPQLHTKSLCVLALQNSQFEASTSSRPQTVNFEALGHKAILESFFLILETFRIFNNSTIFTQTMDMCLNFQFDVFKIGGFRRNKNGLNM